MRDGDRETRNLEHFGKNEEGSNRVYKKGEVNRIEIDPSKARILYSRAERVIDRIPDHSIDMGTIIDLVCLVQLFHLLHRDLPRSNGGLSTIRP